MSTAAAPRMSSTRYDATTSTVAAISPARERLLSLDVFRGITVAGMLLVNNPGTGSAIFPPLEHAEWHGETPTDLIVQRVLLLVGTTTHRPIAARRAQGRDEREMSIPSLSRRISDEQLALRIAIADICH